MAFDYKEYTLLLNQLIEKSGEMRQFRDTPLRDAIAPLCRFLRISKVTSAVFDNDAYSVNISRETYSYYDDGGADDRFISFNEHISRHGTAVYSFFQRSGEESWSDEEKAQIRAFEKHLFVLSERAFTIQLAESLPLHDSEFEVYSLPFFLTTSRTLIAQGNVGEFGAVYFNIRGFSAINQNLGRETSNKVLSLFVKELVDKLVYEECVCRIGSDNFVMLFRKENLDMIRKHLSGTTITYGDNGEHVTVTTYAGYYMIPESTDSPVEIMDRICTAYQLAKNVVKQPYLFFDDNIMKQQEHVQAIEAIFPDAIANEEFKVFYQPKTQLNDYHMAGAEALCRWFRDGSIIPPGEFIPVLESSKAICTLDFYMLDHVCRDIRRWLDEKRDVVKVSVNLSRLHLGDADLLENILGIIDKHNVPHEYIEIELTETTTDVDFTELKKIVNGLREQGISTSVDDFGMGYSSLNLIRELPWNVLKIDKSFLPTSAENQDPSKVKMLRHIITMSQDLGLECIVEGVETAEQVKLLKECQCYLAQGFYFDKPLPVKEFERRLDEMSAS